MNFWSRKDLYLQLAIHFARSKYSSPTFSFGDGYFVNLLWFIRQPCCYFVLSRSFYINWKLFDRKASCAATYINVSLPICYCHYKLEHEKHFFKLSRFIVGNFDKNTSIIFIEYPLILHIRIKLNLQSCYAILPLFCGGIIKNSIDWPVQY